MSTDFDVNRPSLSEAQLNKEEDFAEVQHGNSSLAPLLKKVEVGACFVPTLGKNGYIIQNNLLYRQSEEGLQLVLSEKCRKQVLELGHTIPCAGHL